MSFTAFAGDCTTTTAMALASTFPAEAEVVLLEADRTGGSVAAWLDTDPTGSGDPDVMIVGDLNSDPRSDNALSSDSFSTSRAEYSRRPFGARSATTAP